MAAMSTATFCSDWDAFQLLDNNPNPNPNPCPDYEQMFSQSQHDQLAASILDLDYGLALDSDPVLLPETFFSDQELILSLNDHEYNYHDEPYPKRQKTHPRVHSSFNGFVPNPSMNMLPEFVHPQLLLPPPQNPEVHHIQQPPAPSPWFANCISTVATTVKPAGSNGGGVSVSPQSIAARQRRRRITEKTSELGKLVPSGSKMNTAEMFQAAYKYIKFLQAQVAMLKVMDSMKEVEGEWLEGLQLLASPIVQEKLYSEEKCLVSKEFVETLAKNHDLESKVLLKDSNAKLLRTNG